MLWQLIITFIFVPERTTKRLNCGSAKHYLLFFILVIHADSTAQIHLGSVGMKRCDTNWRLEDGSFAHKRTIPCSERGSLDLVQELGRGLLVCHEPNEASGGKARETPVDLFLSFGGQGPEYQALREALADLGHREQGDESNGATDRLSPEERSNSEPHLGSSSPLHSSS